MPDAKKTAAKPEPEKVASAKAEEKPAEPVVEEKAAAPVAPEPEPPAEVHAGGHVLTEDKGWVPEEGS